VKNDDTHTTIASGISLSGELSAAEDVTIHGRIDGRISVPDHAVTITKSGNVKATRIVARSVIVSGTVDANILAGERIHLLPGTSVRGHLSAPSIVLVDGAVFNGTVDPDHTETAMHVARYRERRGG